MKTDQMREGDWHAIADSIGRGERMGEILKRRRGDALIVRVQTRLNESAIVKLWNRPTWKGTIRRLTRTSSGIREWRILQRMRALGLMVPEPLAYVVLKDPASRYTEALFSEDLGPCKNLGRLVKDLVHEMDSAQLDSVEHELIETTATMVSGGIIDRDHRVTNFVQVTSGQIARIDFELGSCSAWPARWRGSHGTMLGTLIGSYLFLTQPSSQRAVAFAEQLADRLRPPMPILRRTERVIQTMLQLQKRTRNIDTSFPPPW